jgi:hypothetical protein
MGPSSATKAPRRSVISESIVRAAGLFISVQVRRLVVSLSSASSKIVIG